MMRRGDKATLVPDLQYRPTIHATPGAYRHSDEVNVRHRGGEGVRAGVRSTKPVYRAEQNRFHPENSRLATPMRLRMRYLLHNNNIAAGGGKLSYPFPCRSYALELRCCVAPVDIEFLIRFP